MPSHLYHVHPALFIRSNPYTTSTHLLDHSSSITIPHPLSNTHIHNYLPAASSSRQQHSPPHHLKPPHRHSWIRTTLRSRLPSAHRTLIPSLPFSFLFLSIFLHPFPTQQLLSFHSLLFFRQIQVLLNRQNGLHQFLLCINHLLYFP